HRLRSKVDKQRQAADRKNERIPKAEPHTDVPPERLKQAGEHNPLLGPYESCRAAYPPCFAVDARAHQPHWSADRSCNRRCAPGSWSWSLADLDGASCTPAKQTRVAAALSFLPRAALRG